MWAAIPPELWPSKAGSMLGWLLIATSGGCLVVAPLHPASAAPHAGFAWLGISLFLFLTVLALMYAIRPKALGGPMGWFLRLSNIQRPASFYRAHPWVITFQTGWLGLGFGAICW